MALRATSSSASSASVAGDFGLNFPLAKHEKHENDDGGEKVGDHDRPRIARREIALRDDIHDMADAGADQKAGGGDRHGEPRFEAPEGGIERGEPEPEIGDPHFILERARRPADRGGRLLRKEHVTEKGPEALEPEREKEQIAQQPVDDEAAQDRPRLPPDRDAGA